MAGDDRQPRLAPGKNCWLPPHRTVLAVEWPEDELFGARRRQKFAVRGPRQRTHSRRIARHAHVLAVGEAPAMQHRLLHRGDDEAAVRARRNAEMRALPLEFLRVRAGGVGKPKRAAVVMRDSEPEAFRRKSQTCDGRGRLVVASLALLGEHVRGLTGRPGHRALWP